MSLKTLITKTSTRTIKREQHNLNINVEGPMVQDAARNEAGGGGGSRGRGGRARSGDR
jgi:hypothetical protein